MRYRATFAVTVMVALGGATVPAQQAATPAPARLTGIIFADDTGLPIPNASVRMLGPEVQSTTTGDDGRFEITSVPPGSYLVAAVAAGYVIGTAGQRHPTDTPTLVEFQSRAIRSVEIRLTPLGVITGTILDEKGQPAASAEVVAARAQTPASMDHPGYTLRPHGPGRCGRNLSRKRAACRTLLRSAGRDADRRTSIEPGRSGCADRAGDAVRPRRQRAEGHHGQDGLKGGATEGFRIQGSGLGKR